MTATHEQQPPSHDSPPTAWRRRIALFATVLVLLGGAVWGILRMQRAEAQARVCDAATRGQFQSAIDAANDDLFRSDWFAPNTAGDALNCLAFAHARLDNAQAAIDVIARAKQALPDWRADDALLSTLLTVGLTEAETQALRPIFMQQLQTPIAAELKLQLTALVSGTNDLELATLLAPQMAIADVGIGAAVQLANLLAATQPAVAARLLGDELPADPAHHVGWFFARARTLAAASDMSALLQLETRASKSGIPTAVIDAVMVLVAVEFHVDVASRERLSRACNAIAEVPAEMQVAVLTRGVQQAVLDQRFDIARAIWDIAQRSGIQLPTNEPLRRELMQRLPTWTVDVHVPTGFVVAVSPPTDAVDAPFVTLSSSTRLTRAASTWPLRAVLKNAQGEICGSARFWPDEHGRVDLRVAPQPCTAPAAVTYEQRPADGQRTVIAVMLDSGEWRFIRTLEAQGALPVLTWMQAHGTSGTLNATPPSTGAALKKLTLPGAGSHASVLQAMDDFGKQLSALDSEKRHPWPAIRLLLPEQHHFFDTVVEHGFVAVNLLAGQGAFFTERGMRHAPDGKTAILPLDRISDGEPERALASMAFAPVLQHAVREMIETFDAIEAQRASANIILAHIDVTDLVVHNDFESLMDVNIADAQTRVYALYRYIDHRLGRLLQSLDGDDAVVVFSDHGTESGLSHNENAIFVSVDLSDVAKTATRLSAHEPIDALPRALVAPFFAAPTAWPATALRITR